MAKKHTVNPRRHDHIKRAWEHAQAIPCTKTLEELRVPVRPKPARPADTNPLMRALAAVIRGRGGSH